MLRGEHRTSFGVLTIFDQAQFGHVGTILHSVSPFGPVFDTVSILQEGLYLGWAPYCAEYNPSMVLVQGLKCHWRKHQNVTSLNVNVNMTIDMDMDMNTDTDTDMDYQDYRASWNYRIKHFLNTTIGCPVIKKIFNSLSQCAEKTSQQIGLTGTWLRPQISSPFKFFQKTPGGKPTDPYRLFESTVVHACYVQFSLATWISQRCDLSMESWS